MNKHLFYGLGIAVLTLTSTHRLQAQISKEKWRVGAQAGSFGPGLNLTYEHSEKWNFRFSTSFWKHSRSKEDERRAGVSFDQQNEFRLGGIALLADWKCIPQVQKLSLSGGIFYQFNRFTQTRSYFIMDEGAQRDLGSLTIELRTFPVSPYLGVHYRIIESSKNWNLSAEAGALFHGRPKVNFTGTGNVEPTAEQDEIIARNLKNYNFYPNITILFTYKLNRK